MAAFYGIKYDSKLTTKEIARLVREQIKREMKDGVLPKMKVSVKMDTFAGGSSINITVKEAPFRVLNPRHVELEYRNDFSREAMGDRRREPVHTEYAKSILNHLEDIANQYQRDNSDTQTDYFDVKFYLDVRFDGEMQRAEREHIEGFLKAGYRNLKPVA